MIQIEFTLPHKNECLVGLYSTPYAPIIFKDNDEDIKIEGRSIFSIGFLFIRIDIIY